MHHTPIRQNVIKSSTNLKQKTMFQRGSQLIRKLQMLCKILSSGSLRKTKEVMNQVGNGCF